MFVQVQETPLQKLLATALSTQKQQQEQENGGINTGRQSNRVSSSNQNESSSSISPKRQAAAAAAAVGSGEGGTLEAPPLKRSPGRPPGSPNKVNFKQARDCCKTRTNQNMSSIFFGVKLCFTVQVKKDKTVSPPAGRPRETSLGEFVCECGFSSASERGLNIHRR